MRGIVLLLLLAGCAGPGHPPDDHAAVSPGTATPAPRHGGTVRPLGSLWAEGVLAPSGLMVWLTDAEGRDVAPDGRAGTVVLQQGAQVVRADLAPMGPHLHAVATLAQGQPASAVALLEADGAPRALAFSVASLGLAEHDHTSLHGGVVSMFKDTHVEFREVDDRLEFWMSDARREALRAGVRGHVFDGGKDQPLVFDASTGLLSGPRGGQGPRPVVLHAEVEGQGSFELGFEVVK